MTNLTDVGVVGADTAFLVATDTAVSAAGLVAMLELPGALDSIRWRMRVPGTILKLTGNMLIKVPK